MFPVSAGTAHILKVLDKKPDTLIAVNPKTRPPPMCPGKKKKPWPPEPKKEMSPQAPPGKKAAEE